jgi:hypothetical protein
MDDIGYLKRVDGRYEFRCEELKLCVRGDFAEWVMAAAAEMMTVLAKQESEGRLNELETLVEFGEASEIEIDALKFEIKERFEILPQCSVTIARMDYRWAATEARARVPEEFDGHPMKRVHSMAMTRNDTFLANENGVDTSSK